MSLFNKDGDCFYVASSAAIDIRDHLPPQVFEVKYNPLAGGFYLKEGNSFERPAKYYGKLQKMADRIIRTYNDRPATTGVLLSGEKGSGKTLLAKHLSEYFRTEQEMPTLLINQPFAGPDFNRFIQLIDQPCVVLIDEFEKVYSPKTEETEENINSPKVTGKNQEAILTLLDGIYSSKKLFVLTANDANKVNEYMLCRPGRIYYHIKYGPLDEDFVREYCDDALANKSWINNIINITTLHGKFNFDMLQALVTETNRFNEPPESISDILNIHPQYNRYAMSDYSLVDIVDRNGSILTPAGLSKLKRNYNSNLFVNVTGTGNGMGSSRSIDMTVSDIRNPYWLETLNTYYKEHYDSDREFPPKPDAEITVVYSADGVEHIKNNKIIMRTVHEGLYLIVEKAKFSSFSYGNYNFGDSDAYGAF